MTKTYTAIVFFPPALGIRPRKYRNVVERTFINFATRSGAWYVNLYDPDTRAYVRRVYCIQP